jgi:hypothetical protein
MSSRTVILAVFLGLALQTYHFLRSPPVWHDEVALVLNVVQKDFRDLAGPLTLHEAAPPLFLWVERAVVVLFDDEPHWLRLVPFAASCLALVLFAWLARHWLPGSAAAWAVLLFACSDRFLRHGCEAKPYATDLLAGTGLLALYTAMRAWPLTGRILLFALLSPLTIWLSYPGCFLCGGLILALLPEVVRTRSRLAWSAFLFWGAVVAVSFLLLLAGPIRAQRCAEMDSCWTRMFPDWSRPFTIPAWAAAATLDVLHYFANPMGKYLAPLALLGVWHFWSRQERTWLVLLTVPVGLALVASLLGSYPYGGARVMFYAAPAGLLLVGAGLPAAFAWLQGRLQWVMVALAALLLAPLVNSGYRLFVPWYRADTAEAMAYVLAHRTAKEPVLSNAWESLYYGRDLEPPVRLIDEPGALQAPGRVWVVIVGALPVLREEHVEHLRQHREVIERQEFTQTIVLLLGPPSVVTQLHAAYSVMPW